MKLLAVQADALVPVSAISRQHLGFYIKFLQIEQSIKSPCLVQRVSSGVKFLKTSITLITFKLTPSKELSFYEKSSRTQSAHILSTDTHATRKHVELTRQTSHTMHIFDHRFFQLGNQLYDLNLVTKFFFDHCFFQLGNQLGNEIFFRQTPQLGNFSTW